MTNGINATQGIDKKAFNKTVAALVIPMALQNLINVGVQSADVVMLGMVGEEALSAASLAGQVQFVLILIFFGLGSGASVLTAQYWGKKDTRSIEKVMGIAMGIAMLAATVFFVLAEAAPGMLMRLFTSEERLIEMGSGYLRLVAPSYLTTGLTVVYLNVLRSVEKVIISTVVYSVSLGANILANSVFIFGLFGVPAMGVQGAALGTTVARTVELVIVLFYMAKNRVVRLRLRNILKPNRLLLGDFFRYAGPTTLNEMVWALGIATSTAIIGRLGAAAVAANSVGSVTRQLATVVSFGVANAAAIMVGKAIGAGQPHTAQAYAGRLTRLSVFTGSCGALVIFLARPFIVGGMNLSPLAKEYMEFVLLVVCFYVLCQSFNAVMIVGVFRGGGDPRFGLFLDGITMWGFSIVLGALGAFVFQWPAKVVLLVLLLDEAAKLPLAALRYRGRRWLKNVTR